MRGPSGQMVSSGAGSLKDPGLAKHLGGVSAGYVPAENLFPVRDRLQAAATIQYNAPLVAFSRKQGSLPTWFPCLAHLRSKCHSSCTKTTMSSHYLLTVCK